MRRRDRSLGDRAGIGSVVLLGVAAVVLAAAASGATLYAVEKGWLDGFRDTNRPSDLDQSAVETAVHERVNEERVERGLEPVAFDEDLRAIARRHSQDMIQRDFFDHRDPDGDRPIDRYEEYGYECDVGRKSIASENLGTVSWDRTSLTAEDVAARVVTSWLESEDHRANLLNGSWSREGIGMWANRTTVVITQNFC